MKFIYLTFLLILLSSHYINAVRVMQLTRAPNHNNRKGQKLTRRDQRLQKSVKSVKSKTNQKIEPVLLMKFGTMVGKKIISVINNFVTNYNNDLIDAQKELLDTSKIVKDIKSKDCLFYENLKSIVGSHLVTIDLSLAFSQ